MDPSTSSSPSASALTSENGLKDVKYIQSMYPFDIEVFTIFSTYERASLARATQVMDTRAFCHR